MSGFERVGVVGDVNYIATFSDGELVTLLNGHPERIIELDKVRPERPVLLRRSSDDGATWSDPAPAFAYPSDVGFSMPVATVVDQNDRLHAFGLRFLELNWPDGPWKSELLHTTSDDRGRTWGVTKSIDFGHDYTGSINNVIVLDSGRVVLP
ncbi:MAG: exo-alpha-sialidase, partial [Thermomicrobiales bacterium]|nr:exo-alpha-sialidase [Thermomicrobiales bacterium]